MASVILLAGCLKDKDYDNGLRGIDIDGDVKIIELAGPVNGFRTADFIASANDTTVQAVMIRLASEEPAENDIVVTLELDPVLVDEYNTANGTNYQVPPASLFTIPSLTVTIPKGSRVAYLNVSAKPTELIGTEYALGFKISGVSDPSVKLSGNYGEQVVGLVVRNQYDGTYTLRFGFYHPTASPDYATKTTTIELHTTGASSGKLFWPLLGGYAPPIIAGGSFSYFGAQEPEFIIDPATNKVTVQNSYPGAVTFYTMATGYDSRYDPATRTIYAKFGYNYLPDGSFNPASTREWTDTLIYVGPR